MEDAFGLATGTWQHPYAAWIRTCEQTAMRRAPAPDTATFSWGFDHLCEDDTSPDQACWSPERRFRELSRRIVEHSDTFFRYETPVDFELDGRALRFTSPAASPWPENNTVRAQWHPARQSGGRAVVVLPHWNASLDSYTPLCRLLNLFGLSALVMALPCHAGRKPATARAAEFVISANVGRTIACARQAVVDARSCLDWLEQAGYTRLGLVGASLGSGYGFLVSAHEPRLRSNVFNQYSSTISDVVWTSLPPVKQQFEAHLSRSALRDAWRPINAISYFDRFARHPKVSLLISGRYDEVFPRDCVREIVSAFRAHALAHRVVELPCGHYTMGWPPYCAVAAWRIATFLRESM
jgi:pimeloyl-ACP methyl ester carboxylesterase